MLDPLAREKVDPLVRAKWAQDAARSAAPPPQETWLCGLDLGMMSDPTALAIVRKTSEKRDDGKRVSRYACLHL